MFRTEQDRAKCMCQITQGLSHSMIATHGFEMPMIYIPSEVYHSQNTKLPENQIEGLCNLLEQKLTLKVQNNLAKFKSDINLLRKKIAFLAMEQ